MTELKTLKDFDMEYPQYLLRQEAIKHYKALIKCLCMLQAHNSFVKYQIVGQLVWIKDFFNLTAEELK